MKGHLLAAQVHLQSFRLDDIPAGQPDSPKAVPTKHIKERSCSLPEEFRGNSAAYNKFCLQPQSVRLQGPGFVEEEWVNGRGPIEGVHDHRRQRTDGRVTDEWLPNFEKKHQHNGSIHYFKIIYC